MDYYKKKQYLAEVNEQDEVMGPVEKWEAHKKGILHRGYTAILTFEDRVLLQHRKHPVFDDVLDLSFSSHQLAGKDGSVQHDIDAIIEGLDREWGVKESMVAKEPQFLKKFQYKAFDDVNGYYEHEIDYIYRVELKTYPHYNPDFAYGCFTLQSSQIMKLQGVRFYTLLAPWVSLLLKQISL